MKKKLFYIASALTLMFIGLKLADKIDWSYWWVFSPVWIPVVFFCNFWYNKNLRHFISV